MAKKNKKVAEISQGPDEDVGAEAPTQAEACPTYTISAGTRWGMIAMLALHRLVQEWGGTAELQNEMSLRMREFEFYEESHRGDPAA